MSTEAELALRAQIEALYLERENLTVVDEEKSRGLEALTLVDEESARQIQQTTLRKLLQFCHTYIDSKLEVETNTLKTTRGSITSPTGKLCPSLLEPWHDFEENKPQLSSGWKKLPILLTAILLGDNSNTVIPLQYRSAAMILMYDAKAGKQQAVGADQLWPFQGKGVTEELLFVEQYKAPHKLTRDFLRATLQNQATINVEDVREKDHIPTDNDANFLQVEDGAQQLVSMAVTQTHDHLLRSRCTHGCIVTGKSIVFVRVSEANIETLLYYLAEPTDDAIDPVSDTFDYFKTSSGQLVSFRLMAFESSPTRWASTCDRDLERFRAVTPEKKPTTGCKAAFEELRDGREDSNQDEKGHDNTVFRQKPLANKLRIRESRRQASSSSAALENHQQRQYCIQACILGLVQRHAIDESCPSAQLHPRGKRGDTHSLTKPVLRQLLRRQLANSMDEDCQDWHLTGARGMIFQITPKALTLKQQGECKD
ncbi:MAG: hypothetical protein Q9171_004633 [Xanthocarpia ochracea]